MVVHIQNDSDVRALGRMNQLRDLARKLAEMTIFVLTGAVGADSLVETSLVSTMFLVVC